MEIGRVSLKYLYGAAEFDDNGTNVFIGSLPPKDNGPRCTHNNFRYRLCAESVDHKLTRITASYFWGVKAFDCTDESDITSKDFDATEEGLTQAFDYLQEIYDNE